MHVYLTLHLQLGQVGFQGKAINVSLKYMARLFYSCWEFHFYRLKSKNQETTFIKCKLETWDVQTMNSFKNISIKEESPEIKCAVSHLFLLLRKSISLVLLSSASSLIFFTQFLEQPFLFMVLFCHILLLPCLLFFFLLFFFSFFPLSLPTSMWEHTQGKRHIEPTKTSPNLSQVLLCPGAFLFPFHFCSLF